MPATYAVLHAVLSELRGLPIRSLLDLGAGPGTAAWAVSSLFADLERVTLVELDSRFTEIGNRLHPPGPVDWRAADLRVTPRLEPHDLVVCSYLLGELEDGVASRLLRAAWESAGEALVAIEPGTPRGFARIRVLRDELIALGAHLAEPCPHAAACPMREPDGCHFAQRLERTSLHRRAKSGTLGYEDESYSYVAVTRRPMDRALSRILRHPIQRPGHAVAALHSGGAGKEGRSAEGEGRLPPGPEGALG
ncbi:MAG: methyltransferase type 11 [Acidobacteria bacterium]|nr:methyltransferase type 11 [Acidobacteriota bacterium]